MTVEQRLDQLEKRNKRLTVALTMTVVAMCAVATMAATGLKDGHFDTVVAREGYFDSVVAKRVFVKNDAGQVVVVLDTDRRGDGVVYTQSAKGKPLVKLSAGDGYNSRDGTVTTYTAAEWDRPLVKLTSTVSGHGVVTTYQPNGKALVELGEFMRDGVVTTYQPNGKDLVKLTATADGNGGMILVFNKTGEDIVQLAADEYGNGVVGAYNRKGKGRTLKPGP